jgi:YXWGXW repeat-containing protein
MKLSPAFRWLAFGLLLLALPAAFSSPSGAQVIGVGIGGVSISVRIGPPALPVYEQPICPGDGYLWTPGYWAWDDDDGYYWVPGTWVEAPEPGLLWTPGYWGWNDGVYAWNGGYWGPQIGFYGGINYGFGYGGNGFYGGEWRSGRFFYNTAVMRVNTTVITNVYVNKTVIVNNSSHVAFNGGQGGVSARPTAEQETYARQTHTPPVAAQVQHEHAASQNRALFASTNHGRPAVAATARPGEFSGKGVVGSRAAGGTYHAPAMSPKEARASGPAGNRAGESRPAEKRPAESRTPESRSSNAKPAARPEKSTTARTNPSRENNAHESAPRANESHAAKAAPREDKARPASEPRAESKPSPAPKARESAPKESAPKARESAPKASAPKPAHESAPKASAPKPAPHESAPKQAHSAPAPKPQKPAPAPKKESAPPKEEKKGR